MDCNNNHCAIKNVEIVAQKEIGHVDTSGLQKLISSGISFVILDARGGKWDDGKRIAHAENLTYEATAEQVAQVVPNQQTLVVVYCSNVHCPASGYLAKRLLEFGYSNLVKYDEGIQEWINSGHPVRETR